MRWVKKLKDFKFLHPEQKEEPRADLWVRVYSFENFSELFSLASQVLRAKEEVAEERKNEEGEEKLSTNDSFANINVENLETENEEFNVEETAF